MNRRIVLSMVAVAIAIAISWLILPTTTGTQKLSIEEMKLTNGGVGCWRCSDPLSGCGGGDLWNCDSAECNLWCTGWIKIPVASYSTNCISTGGKAESCGYQYITTCIQYGCECIHASGPNYCALDADEIQDYDAHDNCTLSY